MIAEWACLISCEKYLGGFRFVVGDRVARSGHRDDNFVVQNSNMEVGGHSTSVLSNTLPEKFVDGLLRLGQDGHNRYYRQRQHQNLYCQHHWRTELHALAQRIITRPRARCEFRRRRQRLPLLPPQHVWSNPP